MDSLNNSPLLAAPAALDRPAVIDGARTWSWGDVHAQANALSAAFEQGATVCNLCDSRLAFIVTALAAMRRRCVQVLPPSAGPLDLNAMVRANREPVVVVDNDAAHTEWSARAQCIRFAPAANPPSLVARWAPDWDAPAMRLYTSGSTGAPEAHVKTMGQLARGALALIARLDRDVPGSVASVGQVVCSVAPQHMFGLEASVMLPLVAGIAVREGRPLLPADVRDAFAHAGEGAGWIATPLHLRAYAQAGMKLPNAKFLLVSTMPMSQGLAAQAEAFSDSPVLEIYGSTETGVVAMRRTAREELWRPVAGVSLESTERGTLARGGHFTSPCMLADHVQARAGGDFTLAGRDGDMVKIAGRRASLASLNLCLQDLPGLGDGVLMLPPRGADTERLVLVYSGPQLDRAMARRWLRERMDAVFVPREIIRVEKLPRTPNGKVARAVLEEMVAARAKGAAS
jgi:acyl-coenzyme A synthetase/AMP-(fatty) acid ligase